jgi:hypothetical protein
VNDAPETASRFDGSKTSPPLRHQSSKLANPVSGERRSLSLSTLDIQVPYLLL